MTPRLLRSLRYLLLLAALSIASTLITGCATDDSDLPWNQRQPWEGTMWLPGATQR